jgi:hypothetical protein
MHPSSPGIVGTGSGRSATFAPERLGAVIADAQAGAPWRAELGIRQPSTPLEHTISGMFHAAYPDAAVTRRGRSTPPPAPGSPAWGQYGFVRQIRPQLFATSDRTSIEPRFMFVSSDRTQPPCASKTLTSVNDPPLVDANEPLPTTAVTSREHRPDSLSPGCGPN